MLSRRVMYVLCLALVMGLVAAQTTLPPPELKRNDSPQPPSPPVEEQQQQPSNQQNDLAPGQHHDGQSPGDDKGEPEGQPDFAPNFLRPIPHPLFGMFGGNMFDSIRRHQQAMDNHFSNLEQQAGQGQEVQYFSRNGVSYVKTCTTKRV